MKLVHFNKHSCVSKRDYSLAHENFNLPIAVNPDHVISITPQSRTKLWDTSDSIYSSDVWCELKTVCGNVAVDGSYEEVTNKLSQ
jgi:hypothetical protein